MAHGFPEFSLLRCSHPRSQEAAQRGKNIKVVFGVFYRLPGWAGRGEAGRSRNRDSGWRPSSIRSARPQTRRKPADWIGSARVRAPGSCRGHVGIMGMRVHAALVLESTGSRPPRTVSRHGTLSTLFQDGTRRTCVLAGPRLCPPAGLSPERQPSPFPR